MGRRMKVQTFKSTTFRLNKKYNQLKLEKLGYYILDTQVD